MTMLRRAEKKGRKFQNPVPTAVGGPGMMFKVLPLYLTNREERFPKQPLGPFVTNPLTYKMPPESGLRVTWFGHSGMLVEIDGVRILIDPVWDERASPWQWFGPKRFFPPTLRLEEIPKLDAILVSHDHYDHLGEGTVRRLAELQPTARWVTSKGVGDILKSFGVRDGQVYELDWTETIPVGKRSICEITSLPARHFSGRSLRNRFETLWGSFVLKGTSHRVYYGADSGLWDGFAEIGTAYGPFDLTMLEIGAFNEMWHQIHMGPEGAARAFCALGKQGLLMPVHWGLFDLALHAWRTPIEQMLAAADAEGIKLWAPEPGRPTEVIPGMELRSEWWQ